MAKKENKKVITEKDFKITSLLQYRSFANRTMKDLGSKDANHDHMISGLITEIGELNDVYKKEFAYGKPIDKINISEEWADQMWYLANESLVTPYNFKVNESYLNYFRRMNKNKSNIQLTGVESTMVLIASLSKKDYLEMYLSFLFYVAERLEIDVWDSLTKNILKLAERYGEKFSEIKALNRDLDSERKILESPSIQEDGK
jgi:NTP pyrophosphatase (non-canonical NTP hydrolase)